MADALRQAGCAGSPARASHPARSVSSSDPQPILARIPARPEPVRDVRDDGQEDRKLALLLLTAAMVLMLLLVAAGWYLIGRDGTAAPALPAGTASSAAPQAPNPG